MQESLVLLTLVLEKGDKSALSNLLDLFDRFHAKIELLTEGIFDGVKKIVTVALNYGDYATIANEIEDFKSQPEIERILITEDVVLIRILGAHFDIRPGVAGLIYGALKDAKIQILANSTTITSCLLVIPGDQLDNALEAIHSVFKLP